MIPKRFRKRWRKVQHLIGRDPILTATRTVKATRRTRGRCECCFHSCATAPCVRTPSLCFHKACRCVAHLTFDSIVLWLNYALFLMKSFLSWFFSHTHSLSLCPPPLPFLSLSLNCTHRPWTLSNASWSERTSAAAAMSCTTTYVSTVAHRCLIAQIAFLNSTRRSTLVMWCSSPPRRGVRVWTWSAPTVSYSTTAAGTHATIMKVRSSSFVLCVCGGALTFSFWDFFRFPILCNSYYYDWIIHLLWF